MRTKPLQIVAKQLKLGSGRSIQLLLTAWLIGTPCLAVAGSGLQGPEPLSDSVHTLLASAVTGTAALEAPVLNTAESRHWLADMSPRLQPRIPDNRQRADFLATVYYEAVRAGLDPSLVMGVIEVESGFHKYAISGADARGYMQVMPFWVNLVGSPEQDLFHLRTNLRYGCNILRLYLDQENGNLARALGRYNGSLGKPEYPSLVISAWKRHWMAATATSER